VQKECSTSKLFLAHLTLGPRWHEPKWMAAKPGFRPFPRLLPNLAGTSRRRFAAPLPQRKGTKSRRHGGPFWPDGGALFWRGDQWRCAEMSRSKLGNRLSSNTRRSCRKVLPVTLFSDPHTAGRPLARGFKVAVRNMPIPKA